MIRKYLSILVVTVFICCAENIYSQKIIVNSSNSATNISKYELRNIFLGNTSSWTDGRLIHIVDYPSKENIRKKFSESFLKLSPRKVSMIWFKVSLSGKSVPPKIMNKEDDVINFVAANDGAIGYIYETKKLPHSVKILKIN